MRQRGFTLLELIIVVAIIGLLAALLLAALLLSTFRRDYPAPRSDCMARIKQLGMGIKQYVQDYDDSLPRIAILNSTTYGWADAIYPYVRNTQLFQCPSEQISKEPGTDAGRSGYTDYWLNANVSGLKAVKLLFPANTILIGEGNDGHELTDARYVKYSLAPDWYTDKTKPSFRHLDGANYAFVDGHVKWYKPAAITTDPPTKKNVTFLPN